MTHYSFWKKIENIAPIIDISCGCVRVWKSRGKIPAGKIVSIFKALEGTENALSIDELSSPPPKPE